MKTINFKNEKEREERISRAKCALFNRTSDQCDHVRYEKREDDKMVRMCGAEGCACLYKLCPKIKAKKEEGKHGKKK